MNIRISAREFWKQRGQLWLYVISLVFSLGVFLALDSLQVGVDDYIDQEKRNLVGGDIEIDSNRPFTPALAEKVDALRQQYPAVDVYEFSSMVRTDENAVLSQIKVVSELYPLYGEVVLRSGKPFSAQLVTGNVVVEQSLLDQLEIKIGDTVSVGEKQVQIADVIVSQSSSSLNLFSFGPQVFVSKADLEALNLVGDKSRVDYETLFKIPDAETRQQVAEQLSAGIQKPEEVTLIEDADTSLSRFSDRFLLFLKLVIFSLLILTGIGVITLLKAFLQSQRNIIAIRKSLGETNTAILWSYLSVFGFWTAIGIAAAIAVSFLILFAGKSILAPVLPAEIQLHISGLSMLKTIILGAGTSLLFSAFTLTEKLAVTPASLFRIEKNPRKIQPQSLFFLISGACLYAVFIFLELDNLLWSVIFLGGIFATFFLFWGLSALILWVFQKYSTFARHSFRLSIRSLNRSGSATSLFLGIFTLSLTVLFSLIVMENTIQQQFVLSYPENAPNIFLLDIKRDQVSDIEDVFAGEVEFFPVIRAQINRVNDKSIDQVAEESNGFDNLKRAFNITYYEDKKDDESIVRSVEPDNIFSADFSETGVVPVSVMDEIANSLRVDLGDNITFNVQGVEITAQVTSIRSRLQSGPSPFFFFVLPTSVLAEAPQTLFATARVDTESIASLQQNIARQFPQVSFLDTSAIGVQVGDILAQLSKITRFFGIFNLFIGFIIFLASLMATSEERKQEAVFYRLQGMTLRKVWGVLVYEFSFIALFTVIIATATSGLLAQLVLSSLFDLSLSALPELLYFYAVGMLGMVFVTGFVTLRNPLRTTPIQFIRENTRE